MVVISENFINCEVLFYAMGTEKNCDGLEDCIYYQEYQKYKKGLVAAKDIQKLLLGQIPQIPGVDVGYAFAPAEAMSGDFLNVSLFDNDQSHLYIADATGHGLAASAIMLTARAYMKALSQYHAGSAGLVKNVNDLLCSDKLRGKFVTLFYGILDLKNKEFGYTCAGHNPPLLFKEGKNPGIELKKTGPALGLSTKAPFAESKVILEKGNILVLYTDGIVERKNLQGHEFDIAELSRVVLSNTQDSAQQICNKILTAAEEYEHFSEQDDMTVLTVKII